MLTVEFYFLTYKESFVRGYGIDVELSMETSILRTQSSKGGFMNHFFRPVSYSINRSTNFYPIC